MPGIPPALSNRLRDNLARCGPFDSNRELIALFTDARIAPWRGAIPDAAYTRNERVDTLINTLYYNANDRDENALLLFLTVLAEHHDPADALRRDLTDLATDFERDLRDFGQPVAPPEFPRKNPLDFFAVPVGAQQALRNRQDMLQLVHNTWIKGVLEQSLHGAVMLELGKEYRPEAVEHPWGRILQMPDQPAYPLSSETTILDVFDQCSGALLILGDPGSGKTTTLLELCRTLIARAETDPLQPIPVVFNLSSWHPSKQPLQKSRAEWIVEWIVAELNTKYHISRKIGREWIKTNNLLLLLDGLDEVKADLRNACIQAINAFCREYGPSKITVCSRITDYESLPAKLRFLGAIFLQPLTLAQIDAYLAGIGTPLQAVRDTLRDDPTLQELAQSPLFLSVMALAYHGKTIADIQTLTTPEECRQHIFDTYIERMFQRRGYAHSYTLEQTRHWLAWLAGQMHQHDQTIFLIENLQPTWLPEHERRHSRRLATPIIALVYGLVGGLVGHLLGRWGLVPSEVGFLTRLIGLVGGPVAGLVSGLVSGLVVSGLECELESAKPLKMPAWSQLGRIVSSVIERIFTTLLYTIELGGLTGVYGGVIGGTILFLAGALGISSVWLKYVVMSAIIFVALAVGIGSGLSNFLKTHTIIFHYTLRAVLARTSRFPWRISCFLDHCTNCILVRKVGDGYIFIHKLLLEHLALLPAQPYRIRPPWHWKFAELALLVIAVLTLGLLLPRIERRDAALALIYNRISRDQACSDNPDAQAVLQNLTRATELAPSNSDYWNTLCMQGTLLGYAVEVLPACEQAVVLNPSDITNYNNRGLARALTGDREGAIADYEFYLQELPDPALIIFFTGDIEGVSIDDELYFQELLAARSESLRAIREKETQLAILKAGGDILDETPLETMRAAACQR